MPNTYVVTGAAGFIGSHIAERLLRDGQRVNAIDNLLTGKRENLERLRALNGDLSITIGCISELDGMRALCQDADYVLHQAALPSVPRSVSDPMETHLHCVTGTLNLLIAARDCAVKRVVYAASSSAYGDQAGQLKTETLSPAPVSPYGAAKLAGELYCKAFTQSFGLETVALRYFNVFGARQDPHSQYAAVIPRFITRMLRGQPPIITGDGEQSRDFTHVDNVVEGNLLACRAPAANGETINLAAGGSVSINELAAQLSAIIGCQIAPEYAPERPGDIRHSQADISKARELLGYEPVVSFSEGLWRAVEWYRQFQASG